MNKIFWSSIGILVVGIILILGFSLLNSKSEEVIVINSQDDLEAAVGKNVIIKANLYASKLPILKLGDSWIYCWESQQKDWRKGKAADIIREYGLKRGSDQSIKVKVWGKLGKYKSAHPEDQLLHGSYEITYYRMEVDDE